MQYAKIIPTGGAVLFAAGEGKNYAVTFLNFCNSSATEADAYAVHICKGGEEPDESNVVQLDVLLPPAANVVYPTERIVLEDGDYIYAISMKGHVAAVLTVADMTVKTVDDDVNAPGGGEDPGGGDEGPDLPESVPLPSQVFALVYNGASQSPRWADFDEAKMFISGGDISGTDAGIYRTVFALREGYVWPDGTAAPKIVEWEIAKAEGRLAIDKDLVRLTSTLHADTVVAAGDGVISAVSSDTSVATVSVSGNSIVIRRAANGTAVVTVSASGDENHNAPPDVYCTVASYANLITDLTWAEISAISTAGKARDYFDIGDEVELELNGKIGDGCTLVHYKINAFIIGIDHNPAVEGRGRIHFQIGKTLGVPLALHYGQMNPLPTNDGGWQEADMRQLALGQTPVLPPADSLMAALPADLRSVLKSVVKFTDNVGNGTAGAANITSTKDYLFNLSEYEVFGTSDKANPMEKTLQERYEYYAKTGAGKAFCHEQNEKPEGWLLRSPVGGDEFACVDERGRISSLKAALYCGMRPVFCV